VRRPGRLACIAAVAAIVIGCSVAGPSGSPAEAPSADASPAPTAASPLPSEAPSPSPTRSISAAARPPFDSPVPAAAWFLEQSSARFELRVELFKPGLPDESVALGSGTVDPVGDRGTMRYDLFPEDSRLSFEPFDITWDPDDYWVSTKADGNEQVWRHTTRDEAPEMATIGRVNEEPLALLRLAASADRATIQQLPDGVLHGVPAERWLIPIPADRAREAWVPPDTYLGFETIFGLDALPLEIWLVDGRIARVGYVLEREKAPYGGPDRNETWYAWSAFGEPIDLAIPPEGTIEEVGS
jgi:hypothetical protein